MLAAQLRAKVGIERQQRVDARGGRAEMLSHDFGGLKRDVTEMLINFLERAEDQFLGFLMILRLELGQHLADDRKVDFAMSGGVNAIFSQWSLRTVPGISRASKTRAVPRPPTVGEYRSAPWDRQRNPAETRAKPARTP